MKDFSIVIASREVNEFPCKCGDKVKNNAASAPMGLWATLHSCEIDLENSGLDYDYSLMINGCEKPHPDTTNILYYMREAKKLAYFGKSKEALSPPLARQSAVENCDGKYLFFFDNHCLVKPGYFKRALEMMEKYEMDMLHSTTRFYSGQPDNFHYKLLLKKNFWAESVCTPTDPINPYKIACGGHGGFVVKRSAFNDVGGYKWDGFKGYGGEETYFDLKMWLMGKTNWIDPQLIHYHYAGNRGYSRHYTDDYFTNMLSVANIIGGNKWMNMVYENLSTKHFKMQTGKSMFDLMMDAEDISKEHAAWLAANRVRTLDEQLAYFDEHKIAY
jgi:hypothetical protein